MTATSAARTFLLPDLGEGLTEAEVLQWLVAVGDTVAIDQVVVEVETAKAAVEVPCPYGGVVTELHADPGTAVAVGTPLITVSATIGAGVGGDPGGAAAAEQHREEERTGSGNVLIGYGTYGATKARRPRVRRSAESAPPAPAAAAASATPASSPAATGSTDRPGGAVLVISPLIRNLARRHGVDLTTVTATGAGGVIRRSDVEAAIGGAFVPRPAPAPSDPVSPDPLRIPLTGLRKAVATKLGTSRREIPDATTWVDVDATELLAARRTLNAVPGTEPISLLALLARLCLAGLARFPELNSSVDTQRQEILRHRHINLGIAAQTPRGLVVPVVPRADSLTTTEPPSRSARSLAWPRTGGWAPSTSQEERSL